ncbi:hypothetical protein FACS1894162_3850 [Bacteroidia bacterium]|nr:hypothetical protein FACS1894162_3850 [Bacteroidia bacterium]
MKRYTGIDLINKLLEFISLTPNTDNWFLDKQKSNPPRSILLRQILALMDAFEIEEAQNEQKRLSQFIEGGFALDRKPEDSVAFIDMLKKYVDENDIQYNFCMCLPHQMPKLFSQLFAYKRQVYKLLHFNSGCIAASGLYAFAIRLTNAQAHSIDTRDLDAVLECIVNPNVLSFTEEELIANYQYPSEKEYSNTFVDWL